MTEPDPRVEAFQHGWASVPAGEPGDRTRAGLAAVDQLASNPISRAEAVVGLSAFTHPLYTIEDYGTYASDSGLEPADADHAELISSAIVGTNDHTIMLDIDMPCRLVPSSTPGHFHLYIDKVLSTGRYFDLLDTLADLGIIEPGFAGASRARGWTSLRLPWIKKGNA